MSQQVNDYIEVADCGRDAEPVEVCYTDASGVSRTIFVTYAYDANARLVGVIGHDVLGVVVDLTAAGVTLTPGRCDCPKTFVEAACLTETLVVGPPIPGTFDTHTVDTTVFTHLHWIYNSTNNNGYPGAAPIPGPNPSPIDMTNAAAVNAIIASAGMGSDIAYTYITPSTGIFYGMTATAAATYPNAFWIGDMASYNDKASLDAFDPVPGLGGTTSRSVEVIKTLGCDGTVSVRLVEQDGTPIAPQPAIGSWTLGDCKRNIEVREVCIDIAGTVTEAWEIIVRNPLTGSIESVTFEDAVGTSVSGSVVDCTCPSLTPLLEARNTYTGSGMEGAGFPDKWTAGCGPITWQIRAYDGPTLVYTSAMSPALGSAVDAQNWVNGGGGGGYVLFNSFKANATGVGINNWSLPVQSAGDFLIVVAETANTTGTGGCAANIDYGFANFDIAGVGSSPTGWWDTIAAPTLDPVSGLLLGWNVG